ncbi:MAG TPA: cation diffusion facilitator family transporter [Pseudonocardiaceae bacterium]|nr:cation diffusion facilitator family transporter [Pseudonocardiaceae bacterium]
MATEGGGKTVLAALLANAGVAVAKFVGFLLTGSSSMLAEAVHSVVDTSNEGLLLLGRRQSRRKATRAHPFGFGRERFFYGFIVALLLFSLGAAFAVYEGVEKVIEPHPVDSPLIAIIILVVALGFEGMSFRTAVRESEEVRGEGSWWRFIRNVKIPELPVVLLEDSAALTGLVLALAGVGLSVLTGNPVFDGIGTIGIGATLGFVATVLIVEMKSLLIGEGAEPETLRTIVRELQRETVDRVIHIRTQYLGPEEILVAAKIALVPELSLREVAGAIDAAEQRVREAVPTVNLIYLEPDLDRTPVRDEAVRPIDS